MTKEELLKVDRGLMELARLHVLRWEYFVKRSLAQKKRKRSKK